MPTATVKNQGTVATPAGKILDVAFVVDGTTTVWSDTKTTSLGAGASVTLTANGGEIEAFSEGTGRGTIVSIRLPASEAPKPDLMVGDDG